VRVTLRVMALLVLVLTPGIGGAHGRLMMRGELFASPLHAVVMLRVREIQ